MSENNIETSAPLMSLGDILYIVFRHKWKILICLILGLVAALYFATRIVYTSEAQLLVRPFRESVDEHPSDDGGAVVSPRGRWEAAINAEVAILRSRRLAEAVADAIGPNVILGDEEADDQASLIGRIKRGIKRNLGAETPALGVRERVVLGIMRNLSISAPKDSSIISIAYSSKSPEHAQLVVDSVVELYLEYHLKVYRANGTHDFFAQQVDEWRAKLSETEDALRNIRRSYSVASIGEQQRIVTERIGELQRELERAQASLASAKARVGSMSGREYQSEDDSGVTTSTEAVDQSGTSDKILQDRLDRLRSREESLLAVYTADSSLVRKVREQIAQTQDELSGVPSVTTEPGASRPRLRSRSVSRQDMQDEKTSVAALNAQVAAIISQLAAAEDDLRELIDAELKIAQLEREKAVQEANYRTFTAGLERSRIDHELQAEKISNISILQGATRPLAPYDPKKQKKILMALVMGLFGGLGLAFVSEFYLDRSLKRPADIGKVLKVPTLVSIPRLAAKSVSLVRRLKATETSAGGGGPKWHIPLDVRHYYESLCARVLNGNEASRCPETLGVTSCYHGEGVSTVASNLAAAICRQRNGRVLLVDAHIGSKDRKQLGAGAGPVLSSLQPDGNGNATVTQQSQYLLPAGDGDQVAPQHYGRSAYEGIRAKAEESSYDYIVFDIPAVLESSSGYELGGLMDKLILVVESERVRREAAERAGELLHSANANVVGAVLNKRRHYVPRWLYRRV